MNAATARERLAPIWCEVLQIDEAIDDQNFFEVGGESVAAIHLAARVEDELRTSCTIEDVFDNPTLRELSGFVSGEAAM